jgi:hypothetical protein
MVSDSLAFEVVDPHKYLENFKKIIGPDMSINSVSVTRGLRVLREQLFLRLLLTTCRASVYTLDLESCLGTLRQS